MMEPIVTTDNSQRVLSEQEQAECLPNLTYLSCQTLESLRLSHPDLLVFPQDFDTYGDGLGKETMFTLNGNSLVTGNIMGFVGYNGTQLSIRSRFADDGGKDYFLHYILQRVLSLNVFNLDFQSEREDVFDFLIYLFPYLLKEACRQGVYKEYQVRKYNDANIRGRIDFARHIRQNTPFTGRVAYSTREYLSDNHLTQLIRHTIEYVKQHPLGGGILNSDTETRASVCLINECTPSYNRRDRQKIISQNLRPIIHPYYSAYRVLQRLCISILRHDELKYGTDDNHIHGILFDGAWLWEEYLNTILRDLGFVHPRNRVDHRGKKLFSNPHSVLLQPDFYIEGNIVLDAKYKPHTSLFSPAQRDDRFQLLAYMHVFDANRSGLIVPLFSDEGVAKGIISGRGGEMYLIGMDVGKASDTFRNYCDYMVNQEHQLLSNIAELQTH